MWFRDEYPSYDHPRARILTKGDLVASDVPFFASVDSNLLFVGYFVFKGAWPIAPPQKRTKEYAADATGRFLPLVCTLNAARVLTVTARLLGVDAGTLSALALAARPGADGLTLLPYLDGERTPNRPGAAQDCRGGRQ